ncbi:unnamed protein product, partial [Ectocarpus sp. 12 AP-2014]
MLYRLRGFYLLFLSLIIPNCIFAQTESGAELVSLERHQLTLDLMSPGIRYELGLTNNISASTSFSPGLASYQAGDILGYAIHNRLRLYLNLLHRLNKGKNTSGNSGDYFAVANTVFWGNLQITGNLEASDDFALAFYGGMYGVQRTFERGFNYNIELGFGHYQGDGTTNGYGPLLSFSFGWVPTKRKSRK